MRERPKEVVTREQAEASARLLAQAHLGTGVGVDGHEASAARRDLRHGGLRHLSHEIGEGGMVSFLIEYGGEVVVVETRLWSS